MTIASQHQVVRADAALGEAHRRLALGADDLQGSRRLVDRRAGRAGCLGKPEQVVQRMQVGAVTIEGAAVVDVARSEEHTSELQSLMRISYAVLCLKKKKITENNTS